MIRYLVAPMLLTSVLLSVPVRAGERHACALFSKAEIEQAAGSGLGEPRANDLPADNQISLSSCSWRGAAGAATRSLTVTLRIAPHPVPDTEPKVVEALKDGGASFVETRVAEQRALWSARATPLGLNGELHVFKDGGAVYLMIAVMGTGDDQALQTRAKTLAALALTRAGP
ncbi:MAG TPA: hypothetical protein VKZ79_20090 [Alphaproteobacteria bacterium]|nr:hypothetical protein [Alphaproteobacteria bacterium]